LNSQHERIGGNVIYATTDQCTIDRSFGREGNINPKIPGPASSRYFGSLAPGQNGKFFVLAGRPLTWLVGEFDRNGSIDTSFGNRGWVSIVVPGGEAPFSTYPSTVFQERDGTILAFGDNAQSHAGTQAYLYALHINGTIDTQFGESGHLSVFSVMTLGSRLLVQADGSIAVIGGLGGGGCYTMPIEWVSAAGVPENTSDANYAATHSFPLESASFSTNFIDKAGGVGIIGEVLPSCSEPSPQSPPYEAIESAEPRRNHRSTIRPQWSAGHRYDEPG
jgi:hypothetical protein